MIRISRPAEPKTLTVIRGHQLSILRSLKRDPTSSEISGAYREVAEDLVSMQHHKCCYCERRVTKSYNDVEHYRPKGTAQRSPGCTLRHGYWWLAYTWENLLYSCPSCNRSEKNDLFPLATSSVSLSAELSPPGSEIPLLIDPTGKESPAWHVKYVREAHPETKIMYWFAMARDDSKLGSYTIHVCGLNRKELLTLRNYHYDTVIKAQISALKRRVADADGRNLQYELDRAIEMCRPYQEYSLLAYEAFHSEILNKELEGILGSGWPDLKTIFP